MPVQRGVLTSQELRPSGRRFLVADSPEPCFKDRWGQWVCGHEHEPSVPLEDAYQWAEGWTAQIPSQELLWAPVGSCGLLGAS